MLASGTSARRGHSLRSRLAVLWALSLAAALAVAVVLLQLYNEGSAARQARAEAVAARACDSIRASYDFYVSGWDGADGSPDSPETRRGLASVVATALARLPAVEGGIWWADGGSLTGSPADAAGLRDINAAASRTEQTQGAIATSGDRTMVLAACPLAGPFTGLTAWIRITLRLTAGYGRLQLGLSVLLVLVLGIAGWVGWLVLVWARHVRAIETTLTTHEIGALPQLAPTGERELDRIVAALNQAGARLAESRAQSEAMARQVVASERLAALGRLAAGVAHELRNPMASMRLRAENALASDAGRQRGALEASLVQIGRLDRLVSELLAMTQRREPSLASVALQPFLAALLDEHRAFAGARGVTLGLAADGQARFDPELISRAITNLVLNAIQHSPAGGHVAVWAERGGDTLAIMVEDAGPGVAPGLLGSLFEPFVTGRADGTGLGLAIARELAQAHGGKLVLRRAGGNGQGALFALELPGADMELTWH